MDKHGIIEGLTNVEAYLVLKVLSDDNARYMLSSVREALAFLKKLNDDGEQIVTCRYCKYGHMTKFTGEYRIVCYNCLHPQQGYLSPDWHCGDGVLDERKPLI